MIFYLTFGELDSWLTLEPLGQLMAETPINVEVRPMLRSLGNVVSEAKRGEIDPLAGYKMRRAGAHKQASKRELARQCDRLGISAEQALRKIDPTMLSLGLLWINRGANGWFDYCQRAFLQTFRENGDVESLAAVAAMISETGASTEGFEGFAASERSTLLEGADALLEQGLLSAPVFVLEGEIFHGREHLPLIRWIVSGRAGVPPV